MFRKMDQGPQVPTDKAEGCSVPQENARNPGYFSSL